MTICLHYNLKYYCFHQSKCCAHGKHVFRLVPPIRLWVHVDAEVWVKCKCVPNELRRRLYHTTPHCTSHPRRLPKSTNSLFAKPPTPLNRNRPGSSLRLLGGGGTLQKFRGGISDERRRGETYHLVHGHEVGIQGDDSEVNLKGGGENTNWFVRNITATMTWWTLYRALGQTIIH